MHVQLILVFDNFSIFMFSRHYKTSIIYTCIWTLKSSHVERFYILNIKNIAQKQMLYLNLSTAQSKNFLFDSSQQDLIFLVNRSNNIYFEKRLDEIAKNDSNQKQCLLLYNKINKQQIQLSIKLTLILIIFKEYTRQDNIQLIKFNDNIIKITHTNIQTMLSELTERKIHMLESQVIQLNEELISTKIKLKGMEDFQLKYQIILNEFKNQNQKRNLRQEQIKRENNQLVSTKLRDLQKKLKSQFDEKQTQYERHYTSKYDDLQRQYNMLKSKYDLLNSKRDEVQLFNFKLKKYENDIASLQQKIQNQRQYFQKSKTAELNQLKTSLTNKFREREDKDKKENDQNTQKLRRQIEQLQFQRDMLQQKNRVISAVDKSQNKDNLNKIIQDGNNLQKQQNFKLLQRLQKNRHIIQAMLFEKQELYQKHSDQLNRQLQYSKSLELKLFQNQKDQAKQIFNIIERMSKSRDQEVSELKNYIKQIQESFQKQKTLWDNMSNDHKAQIQQLQQKYQAQRKLQLTQKQNFKRKISELSSRLKQYQSNRENGQTQLMINSLKQIDSRQDNLANYQNGITFLERQLKKNSIKLQQKNRQISRLIQQVSSIREQTDLQIKELKANAQSDKKQSLQKILQLQNNVRDLNDALRIKQKEVKKKQKDTSFQKIQLQSQNASLKDAIQQLKKDYNRILETRKSIQNQYRDERDKGITVKGYVNFTKRQKWLQLQKQKFQLQIIFRQKQEQLKIQNEMQLDQLRIERDSLKKKVFILEDQKNRLINQVKNISQKLQGDKQNNKLALYQKKMASLNLQIALTQNLYETLQKAKSRIKASEQ